jgi:hypothetical protein
MFARFAFPALRFLTLGLLFSFVGCSNAPSRVTAPGISGSAAADAIAKYDKNSDGALDDEELKAVPALSKDYGTGDASVAGAKSRFDKNADGKITSDEITARIDEWVASKVGLLQFSLQVTMDGRPLEGATVTLVPEEFLGPSIKSASGVTDATGRANTAIAAEDLQANETGLSGMRVGVYKVQVTHPTASIPAKYNTDTTIGVEVAQDDPESGRLVLPLKSR